MTKSSGVLFLILLLVGFSGAAQNPPTTVSFIETDAAGQTVRKLSFALTENPAKTCISGDWKEAKVLGDEGHYTRSPAYTLDGDRLEVLLVNTLCDSYDSYTGNISGGAFSGEHVAYGLSFSKNLGKVAGEFSRP